MYEKALNHVKANTHTLTDYSKFGETIEKGGYIKMSVSLDAEEIIKEEHKLIKSNFR